MNEAECGHFPIVSGLLTLAGVTRPDVLHCLPHRFDTQFQARLHQLCPPEASPTSADRSPYSSVIAPFLPV